MVFIVIIISFQIIIIIIISGDFIEHAAVFQNWFIFVPAKISHTNLIQLYT